jgi:nucleoside-diphosphate-sugar epimerase
VHELSRRHIDGKDVQGQSALAIGSVSLIHDFCYVKDFAKALAVDSQDDRAYDKFWICPHSIHDKTIQTIANDISVKVGGKSPVPISVLNWFLLYLLCPFMGFAWEMIEMLPFWTQDYKIDDSDFIKTFSVEATPYDAALQSLVDFYQSQQK